MTITSILFNRRLLGAVIVLAGLAAGVYFNLGHAQAAPATASASAPPVEVVVKTLRPEKTRVWTEYSGRLHAVDYAELRPEVSGRITQINFQDGQLVKAGDVLVVIDPRPFEAAVQRAEANVTAAQSKLEVAGLDQQRAASLIATHAIAQSELDRVNDVQRVAAATLESAQADLTQAKLDVEHARVEAPISGRVSRAEITVGNLVQSGSNAPVLTSIVSNDGIYADFEVDEQTYLQTVRVSASSNAQERHIPVQVVVPGDKDTLYNGFIQSFDNRLDVTTGTIRARAKFDNADGTLVPGMFVSVKLTGSKDNDVLLIPDRAVSFDQSKKYVFVVDAANKVSYREVVLGQSVGSQRIVKDGLKAGDRIIVDGVQHVHPDDVVSATEAPASSDVASNKP